MQQRWRRCLCAAIVAASCASRAAAGDRVVSARLETEAGYDGNRFEEPGSGRGSAFVAVAPGADLMSFGAATERTLTIEARHTAYGEDGFGRRRSAALHAAVRGFAGRATWTARAGAGVHDDTAWPERDGTCWQVAPAGSWSLSALPLELDVRGLVRGTRFEGTNGTTAQAWSDTRAELRPGLRWHPSRNATVWIEAAGELVESDAAEESRTGAGVAAGCRLEPTPRLAAGIWAEGGQRAFDAAVGGRERTEEALRGGAWMTWRQRPWLEYFVDSRMLRVQSTIAGEDYSTWQASAGLRLVFEHARRPRR